MPAGGTGSKRSPCDCNPPLGSRSRYGEMLSGSTWPGQERNEAKGQHRPAEEQREPSRHGGRSGIFGQRKNYRRRWCDEQTGTRKLAGRSQIDLIPECSWASTCTISPDHHAGGMRPLKRHCSTQLTWPSGMEPAPGGFVGSARGTRRGPGCPTTASELRAFHLAGSSASSGRRTARYAA
jgi:hypothetical protein